MYDESQDRQFDAALAKYADVKPRAGLEQRVLANLRAERARGEAPFWWRWPAAAALVAIILIASVPLLWKSAPSKIAKDSTAAQHKDLAGSHAAGDAAPIVREKPRSQIGNSQERPLWSAKRTKAIVSNHVAKRAAQGMEIAEQPPKLERFPAPEPLSEQEQLLVRFVEDNPADAALFAEARTEALQQEADELKSLASIGDSEAEQR
jgi:hypothetical protein